MPTPYDIFQYNIGKSIGLLRLLQWKHFIRELGINSPYLPGFNGIKNQIIKSLDDRTLITDVGLYQQCIVTSMTAVEVYLSDVFDETPKKIQPKKKISFQYLKPAEEAYEQHCELKLFKDIQTKIDLSFLMEVRHKIIHKGGTIDQNFMDNCSGKNNKYNYCCFDSKYVTVTNRSKFQEEHELNFLFDDEMIESVHKDVKSFIEDVHSKTGL